MSQNMKKFQNLPKCVYRHLNRAFEEEKNPIGRSGLEANSSQLLYAIKMRHPHEHDLKLYAAFNW